MKNILTATLLGGLVLLVSCGGGGGGGGGGTTYYPPAQPVNKANDFVNMLNNRYVTDSTYSIVKRPEDTLTEGFVVVNSIDTEYVAYDLKYYQVGMTWSQYTNVAEYQPVYIDHTERDAVSFEVYYTGAAYTNSAFPSYAGEFMFEETSATGKDLEKRSALREAFAIDKIGKGLALDFGLTEERGAEIAKIASNYKKMQVAGKVSDKDADLFSEAVIGMKIKDATSALTKASQGDASELDALEKAAARVNGVGPEQVSELLTTVLGIDK